MSIILSPSSSLQFRFLRRWASSITTQRHGTLRSSGQSVRIISKVVMTAWNRYTPLIILPCRHEERQTKKEEKNGVVKLDSEVCSPQKVSPFSLFKPGQIHLIAYRLLKKSVEHRRNKQCRLRHHVAVVCPFSL